MHSILCCGATSSPFKKRRIEEPLVKILEIARGVPFRKIRQNFVLAKEEKATDNGARQGLAIKDVGFRRRRDSLTARTCSSVQPGEKTKPFCKTAVQF